MTDLVPRLPDVELVKGGDVEVVASRLWRKLLGSRAALTQENYERDLADFAAFHKLPSPKAVIAKLLCQSPGGAHEMVVDYHAHLQRARVGEGDDAQIGYAPATVRRRIYAIRAVVDLAYQLGLVTFLIRFKLGKVEAQRGTAGPGPDGYASVLAALDLAITEARAATDRVQLERALRDRVMIRLLHDSGLRRFEVCGIEWPKGVRLGDEPSVLVLGKGRRRHQWAPISTVCARQVDEYLEVRGRHAGYLLTRTGPQSRASKTARKLDKCTVNRRVAYWGELAGVMFTPHGLKHTATTTALDEEKGDKTVVKQWSRHLSESSLDPYDDRRRQDDRRIAEYLSDPSRAKPHS